MGNQNPNQPAWQSTTDASKLAVQAERAAEQVASSALDRVQDVREKAESGIAHQRDEVSHRIKRVSEALRATGEDLHTRDQLVAGYLKQAGERVDQVAHYVGKMTLGEVSRDVQRFAKERPAWFFGGTFLLGLAAGRFLKSTQGASSPHVQRYDGLAPRAPAYSARTGDVQTRGAIAIHAPEVRSTPESRPNLSTNASTQPAEPRVYGKGTTNGDKPSSPTSPGAVPGTRTS